MELPKFNFIRDEPQDKDNKSYFNFYHENVAPALSEILKADTTPHTIGIFGSWGTGKSTIINLLKNDKKLDMPVFLFDAWKYQDDSLRRIFLIKFKEFLETDLKVKFKKNYLFDFYNSTQETAVVEPDVISDSSKWMRFVLLIKNNILITVLITSAIILGLVSLIWSNSQFYQTIVSVLVFISSISVIGIAIKPIFEKVMEKIAAALLQTSTTSKNASTYVTGREKLNSPEEFEDRFKDMLSKIGKKKLVIVFDNIDRVQGDTAISMISTIKTFMEPNSESKVVFLIPCDPDAIDEQIKQYYSRRDNSLGSYSSSDYLRKVFNLILWLPNYVATDLEEYTKKCLEESGEISKHTNNPEVILVINSAFSRNPRDIIQFVNNLTALIITAYQTKIAEKVLDNVAYLAKVQVIKQKFPEGYKRLQKSWNEPETIYLEDSKDPDEIELKEFMRITSRITTEDAEPFIYFKDPLDTRGLANSNKLLETLISGDGDLLKTQISSENNNEAVSKFVLDVLSKYRSIPDSLIAIYNAQFMGIIEIVPEDLKEHYINSLYSTLDTQVWKYNDRINLEATLTHLSNPALNADIKQAIVTRYIEAVKLASADNPDLDLIHRVISAIVKNESLFSEAQIDQVKYLIDSNSKLFEKVKGLFVTVETQKRYVPEKAFFTHFDSMISTNVVSKMQLIELYKDFILSESYIADILEKFTASLEADYNSDPSNPKVIIPYTEAIKFLFKNLRPEIKNESYQDYLNRIYNVFNSSFTSYSTEEQKPKLMIALYWLHGNVTAYNDNILNSLNNFMSSYSFDTLQPFFDYWDNPTKNTIFKMSFEYLKPKFLTDINLVNYCFQFSSSENKKALINYLASQTLSGQVKDFFIQNSVDDLLDQSMEGMLGKQKNTSVLDDYDIDILADHIKRNSPRTSKEHAIDIIELMIENFDEKDVSRVTRILTNSTFLASDDKKRIARKLLAAFIDEDFELYENYSVLVEFVVSTLTSTAEKNTVVNSIFKLIPRATQTDLANALFDELKKLKVQYKSFEENVTNLYTEVSTNVDDEVKETILKRLPDLTSSRPTKAEKEFWESISPNTED